MRIEIVHWPEEQDVLARLRAARTPRLIVVDADVEPPPPHDLLEDWIRVTAPWTDIEIRSEHVLQRASLAAAPGDPDDHELSEVGVFRWHGRTVILSPIETRLTRALLFADGAVVPRQALESAGWPGTAVRRSTFDASIARLRKRLTLIGLDVCTIRNRGYLLADSGRLSMQDNAKTADSTR